jgi:hypothetical protein
LQPCAPMEHSGSMFANVTCLTIANLRLRGSLPASKGA